MAELIIGGLFGSHNMNQCEVIALKDVENKAYVRMIALLHFL